MPTPLNSGMKPDYVLYVETIKGRWKGNWQEEGGNMSDVACGIYVGVFTCLGIFCGFIMSIIYDKLFK